MRATDCSVALNIEPRQERAGSVVIAVVVATTVAATTVAVIVVAVIVVATAAAAIIIVTGIVEVAIAGDAGLLLAMGLIIHGTLRVEKLGAMFGHPAPSRHQSPSIQTSDGVIGPSPQGAPLWARRPGPASPATDR